MNPEAVAVAIEGVGEVLRCPRCGGEMREDVELSSLLLTLRVVRCRNCGYEDYLLRR